MEENNKIFCDKCKIELDKNKITKNKVTKEEKEELLNYIFELFEKNINQTITIKKIEELINEKMPFSNYSNKNTKQLNSSFSNILRDIRKEYAVKGFKKYIVNNNYYKDYKETKEEGWRLVTNEKEIENYIIKLSKTKEIQKIFADNLKKQFIKRKRKMFNNAW